MEGTPRCGGNLQKPKVLVPVRPQCVMRCAYTKKVFIVYLKFRFHCVFCRYLLNQTTLY